MPVNPEPLMARWYSSGSDNPSAGGLERARHHGIANFVVDYRAILQRFRRQPLACRLPEDFDLQDCLCKQHVFPDEAPVQRVSDFLGSRAIAESELLMQMANMNLIFWFLPVSCEIFPRISSIGSMFHPRGLDHEHSPGHPSCIPWN